MVFHRLYFFHGHCSHAFAREAFVVSIWMLLTMDIVLAFKSLIMLMKKPSSPLIVEFDHKICSDVFSFFHFSYQFFPMTLRQDIWFCLHVRCPCALITYSMNIKSLFVAIIDRNCCYFLISLMLLNVCANLFIKVLFSRCFWFRDVVGELLTYMMF